MDRVELPFFPEIAECNVIYHKNYGYLKAFEYGAHIRFTANILEAKMYPCHDHSAQNGLAQLRANSMYRSRHDAEVVKAIVCLDN